MAREKVITSGPGDEQKKHDAALRPKLLKEVIGQRKVAERLEIAVRASKKLNEPLGHILFDGPPGLGKTTFATVLPNELGTSLQMTSGPALAKPADLLPFLTNLEEGSVLFIDEIHRMPRVVEEFIYPAMEDFRIDIVLGEGMSARTISMTLKRFTLIGATTRSGMLSGPMRDRFKMHEHLEFYSVDELATIATVNAAKLNTPITSQASLELARRSRGTPRVANSRLHWTRSFAAAQHDGTITEEVARAALDMAEVDRDGLDKNDRKYLETLIDLYGGGPTGVEALAATINLASDTLSDEIEPYLLREQYITRSPRGRVAMPRAYSALGKLPPVPKPKPDDKQGSLFE
ncbi:Holliday junction ATP-dependent DNA helicase RuvB [Gemmata obscuriglobus]|uniref:Holliday junction branch migration complex subunit RuvB n=1 Tax=Gemmata obscuriglobus TaxID=114 RepID=A0A2Z3H6F2_9BACT|nr:Holliday junction branch migration DNA helicase RuvB [Gemmata obscuriglobus]AWM41338.1 Holliday junction branch migration DNA helicase RuvB [Gemmata obscuriglobus]QEG25309.1 Holliday junction ATP-dependent DNA helicase RuvB [Gemmata obscuriglobus]VTR98189.1 holliday junction dna helicase : Holliday junction ATP-dependent DNA helicase RuvB OS=Singulisphaera acidiphila (strain ATCC BAA-1392 / DSM 18658 / VKM B-2454 / MOB10) GN=ruvB PE=3 SV=1: RuvB_N: RuvB_C [Gemmata obscuriglobus UQM 2246]